MPATIVSPNFKRGQNLGPFFKYQNYSGGRSHRCKNLMLLLWVQNKPRGYSKSQFFVNFGRCVFAKERRTYQRNWMKTVRVVVITMSGSYFISFDF